MEERAEHGSSPCRGSMGSILKLTKGGVMQEHTSQYTATINQHKKNIVNYFADDLPSIRYMLHALIDKESTPTSASVTDNYTG